MMFNSYRHLAANSPLNSIFAGKTLFYVTAETILRKLLIVCFGILLFPVLLIGSVLLFLHTISLFIILLVKSQKIGYLENGVLDVITPKFANIVDIVKTSTIGKIDFRLHRTFVYLRTLYIRTVLMLAQRFTTGLKTKLISDEDIVSYFINTGGCHYLSYDPIKHVYSSIFYDVDSYILDSGYYYDVREVKFTLDGPVSIIFKEKSVVKAEASLDDWNLAKIHLQVMISFYQVAVQHNWVHFVLPSAFTVNTPKVLGKNSILRKLITPHIRFTDRINQGPLNLGQSSNNKRSLSDRYFRPWSALPMTKKAFVEHVVGECNNYYFKQPEEICPPPFFQNPGIQQLPYVRQVRGYYDIIRKFVCRVALWIDPADWECLSETLNASIPGISALPMVDVLTTFIWQAAIVHSYDHASFDHFVQQFNSSCMLMQVPYKPYSNVKFWEKITTEKGLNLEAIKADPTKLFCQDDLSRTYLVMHTWIAYIPNIMFDRSSMKYVNYHFKEKDLIFAQNELIKEFVELHHRHKNEQEQHNQTLQVKLDEILQSIRH